MRDFLTDFFYQYLYRFLLLLIYKLKGEKIVYMYVYVHIVVVLQKKRTNYLIIKLLGVILIYYRYKQCKYKMI